MYYIFIEYILTLALVTNGKYTSEKRISKTNDKVYLLLTFGLFLFFSAFRASFVGNDTKFYLDLYKNISWTDNLDLFTGRIEIGFVYLNKLLSLVFTQPQIILIVTSVIFMLAFCFFIYKYSTMTWLSVYLFFVLRFFDESMNIIRLDIALAIVLFSYNFIRKKQLFRFIFLVLIATLFHATAIAFLLAYPISRLKFNFKFVLITICGSIILFFSFSSLLNELLLIFPKYQYYVGTVYLDGNVRIASIMNLLVGLSILLIGIKTNYHNNSTELKIELIGDLNSQKPNVVNLKDKVNDGEIFLIFTFIWVVITFLSINFALLSRVGLFFEMFAIVYLPNAIKQMKNKKLALLYTILIVILFFIYATEIQIFRPDWNRIYPYDFFWNE
ncbi:EpsG family protein [Paenibacillus sp. GP183]|uniref:EpsG family protein n=1 Tax=Paenibacillus sp. GP183 TaxID=1882751 RepID=UPI001495CA38|nr:EpsG family protein [Paenibacillus sp. GP183]